LPAIQRSSRKTSRDQRERFPKIRNVFYTAGMDEPRDPVDYHDWFIREVEKGLAQIERQQTLAHEEVGVRIEKLILRKQSRAD
jgi:hypothetical protein